MRTVKTLLLTATITSFAALSQSDGASAQSTVSPSADWNGNYGFSSTADRNLRLLQSDLIKKAEEGYYESIGRATYHVTTNNNVTNNSTTEIGQQTTTIGAVNNATNNIDISHSSRIDIGIDNSSSSIGCQDGSITIDSRPGALGDMICN